MVYPIEDESNQIIAYVGGAVSLDYLSFKVQSFLQSSDNDVIILSGNEDKELVYFTDPIYEDYLFQNSSQFETIDIANGLSGEGLSEVISQASEGLIDLNVFTKNYLVTYNDIDDLDWQVVVLVYDSQPISYEILLIISLAAVGVLLFIVGIILNRSIKRSLQPIHDIIQSIEEIKNGNYQIEARVYENNEIKEIADAINLMSQEIDRQVKLIYDNFAYDQLTGLKNKSAVTKELNDTVFKGDKKTAVVLLQVDNLKDIIIIKGQMMGDSLIKAIAEEIDHLITEDEMLFSNGGNELLYIIPDFNNLADVRDKVNRVIQRFRNPIIVNNVKTEIKIYAGIATYPSDDHNLDGLIKKCDVSIYKDKNTERKQVIFYNDRISQEISYQAEVSEQLAQALEKKEIFLKYQPLIDIKSEIYGFEALARWSSPVLGDISPDIFISNAEENYLIIPIGTWILREACRTQVMLREKFNKEFVISVNVSLIQIMQNDYVDIVKRIIKETDINPEYLTIELTESIFIKSTIALDGKIDELHKMGVKFSLDDFGTGYASLTYLRNIAFDNLKIDKSFIDGILGAKKENRIVGTIVSLVHNLDMKVIAEGVEHKSQYEYLKQISTDIYQGFIMSKPLTVDETIEFIDQFYKIAKSKRVDVLASQNE
jgi:diguanylate cyclase (GGDEF)-like protein